MLQGQKFCPENCSPLTPVRAGLTVSWSFAQFQAFVTYKAEARGIKVDYVDPGYTSQKCSQCGHIDRKNRPTQSDFKCKKCGYKTHADYNAATNIRADYLRAAVNQPIVSTDGNVGQEQAPSLYGWGC